MKDDEKFLSGVLPDTRTDEEKANAYQFHEIVALAEPVNWTVKKPSEWRRFPIFDQNGSGSCMAQTLRKLLGIIVWLSNGGVWLDFSATDIYRRRINKDSAGMGIEDLYNIGAQGVTLNALMPSDKLGESAMTNAQSTPIADQVRPLFKISLPIYLPVGDIDAVASVIQRTRKGVQTLMYWNYPEYTDIPQVLNPNLKTWEAQGVHSTAQVDFTMIDQTNAPTHPEAWGKKALVMDDSWDRVATALDGQRLITEDFYKARNFCTVYPMQFTFQAGQSDKPKHHFDTTKIFEYDPKAPVVYNNPDIIAIQDILRYEGFFPLNVPKSTGYFGSITRDALKLWQKAHGIKATGAAAVLTLTEMNKLYA